MTRNNLAIAVVCAGMAVGGLFAMTGGNDDTPPVLRTSPVSTSSADVYAGAINGNVPAVAYDNVRAYLMVVLPPGGNADPFCQKVLQTFGGDPVIRSKAIVKLHNADANFCYRWGRSFEEAERGFPTVAIMHEMGDQARSVYKMPMTPQTNLAAELDRCRKALVDIDLNCVPCRPKPAPAPAPPGPNQPAMPPVLPNTPNDATPLSEDNKSGLILIAVVAFVAGAVSYYKR